jgi:hypothetical protein
MIDIRILPPEKPTASDRIQVTDYAAAEMITHPPAEAEADMETHDAKEETKGD